MRIIKKISLYNKQNKNETITLDSIFDNFFEHEKNEYGELYQYKYKLKNGSYVPAINLDYKEYLKEILLGKTILFRCFNCNKSHKIKVEKIEFEDGDPSGPVVEIVSEIDNLYLHPIELYNSVLIYNYEPGIIAKKYDEILKIKKDSEKFGL